MKDRNTAVTKNKHINTQITAHADKQQKLVMFTLTTPETTHTSNEDPSIKLALVLDRSGSMAGPKLDITRKATAKLIRSLNPADRVAVIAYDQNVNVLTDLAPPSSHVASLVDELFPGGTTNLYGGWIQGAELIGSNGAVVLLSDGQANSGLFTDAENLQSQTAFASQQNSVTTTTIGVGSDYDEQLMAGMAIGGSGNHYFAKSAGDIVTAFSQERFSIGAIALQNIVINWGGTRHKVEEMLAGEVQHIVIPTRSLRRKPPTLEFTVRRTGKRVSVDLKMPAEFGTDDEVTLQHIFDQVAILHETMATVQSTEHADKLKAEVLIMLKKLKEHPLANEDIAQTVIASLENSVSKLEALAHRFDPVQASLHRKAAYQTMHNMRRGPRGYGSSAEEAHFARQFARRARSRPRTRRWKVNRSALRLAPIQSWISWQAVPVKMKDDNIWVIMVNPKDAFVVKDIESALAEPIRIIHDPIEPDLVGVLLGKELMKGTSDLHHIK